MTSDIVAAPEVRFVPGADIPHFCLYGQNRYAATEADMGLSKQGSQNRQILFTSLNF